MKGNLRLGKAIKGKALTLIRHAMPLTRAVSFKAVLQKNSRIAIPKLMRWEFKMEPEQTLQVKIQLEEDFAVPQVFYAKMTKDGRIHIPLLTLQLIANEEKPALTDHAFEITIRPA